MDLIKSRSSYRIEKLLRRGVSKLGVISHLSYRNLLKLNYEKEIDIIYNLILSENNFISKKTKGKINSDILFIKPNVDRKIAFKNKYTSLC